MKQLERFIIWVAFNGDEKPTESISDARWRAIVTHIRREYVM